MATRRARNAASTWSVEPFPSLDPNHPKVLAGEDKAECQEVRVFAYDRKAFGKRVSRDLRVGGGFHAEISDVSGIGKHVRETSDKLVTEVLHIKMTLDD